MLWQSRPNLQWPRRWYTQSSPVLSGAVFPFLDRGEPPPQVLPRAAGLARLGDAGLLALSDAGRPRSGPLARRDLTEDDREPVLDDILDRDLEAVLDDREDPEDIPRRGIVRDRDDVLLLEW